MAQQYETGPCHLFVAPFNTSSGGGIYLGTSDDPPDIDNQPREQGAKASQGGVAIDFDTADQGQEAFISFTLIRWNETTLLNLISLPDPSSALMGTPASAPGTYVPGGVGTLAMLENQGVTIFLQFPYSAKPAMTVGNAVSGAGGPLRRGYRYPFCKMVTENYPRNGTIPMAVTMAFHARRLFNATAGQNSYGVGTFTLYDFDVLSLPATN
jgi:hypothetical protein